MPFPSKIYCRQLEKFHFMKIWFQRCVCLHRQMTANFIFQPQFLFSTLNSSNWPSIRSELIIGRNFILQYRLLIFHLSIPSSAAAVSIPLLHWPLWLMFVQDHAINFYDRRSPLAPLSFLGHCDFVFFTSFEWCGIVNLMNI